MSFQQEHLPDKKILESLSRMLNPKSVAVLGVSHNPLKWGHRVLHSLLAGKFQGRLYPVNPRGGRLLGLEVSPSIQEITDPVDLALIIVPPQFVLEAVKGCVEKKVGSIFVITAGFSEVGTQGKKVEREMAEMAGEAGIALGGPNGQGLTCAQAHLCAQMYPIMPPTGGISLITQSGNIGVTMAHMALYHDVGFSKIISAGNEAALTTAHYLDYLAEDPDTEVVALYMEGVEQGRHLLSALERVSRRKPVVVLKSGHTEGGARAAISHTGSLAGEDRIYEAAFRQTGAVRVRSLEGLFDTAATFATQPLPAGNRVAMVTVGGGWGVLGADAAAESGLTLPRLPKEILEGLDQRLPDRWSRANPIDFAAGGTPGVMLHTVEKLLDAPQFDSLAVLGLGHPSLAAHFVRDSSLGGDPTIRQLTQQMTAADVEETQAVADQVRSRGKPFVVASDAALSYKEVENEAVFALKERGFHLLSIPDRALRVLGKVTAYAQWRREHGVEPKEVNRTPA